MRRKQLGISFSNHFQNNLWLYITSLISISVGILVGVYAVKYMVGTDKEDLISYLSNFTECINLGTTSYKSIFFEAVKSNISLLVVIWFLGFTILGMPLIVLVSGLKGFTLGFSIGFMIDGLGIKGLWVALLGILPQNIIYIPCVLVSSVLAMEFSIQILRDRFRKQVNTNIISVISSYSMLFVIIGIIMCSGFALETYLTPNLLRIIVSNIGGVLV